jgi:1-acyl-sn-glycerol-3-phosphate acyltransferase
MVCKMNILRLLLLNVRASLYLLYCLLSVVFFAVLVIPLLLCPVSTRFAVLRWWPRLAIHAARWILGIRWQIKGVEHLPHYGASAVLMPKHQSTWETFFLCAFLESSPVFVYKKQLNWIPFFGWGLKSLQWISIDRTQRLAAFEQVKLASRAVVESGRSIIMFPEGTRTAMGTQTAYKSGGTRLAIHLGVPVIPIAHNAGALWPRRAWLKQAGLITVSIGAPIASTNKDSEVLLSEVKTWIEQEMQHISPEFYPSKQHSSPPLTE